jgi:hypothetical protein
MGEETPHTALGRAASKKCTTAMHIYCDLRITIQVAFLPALPAHVSGVA